MKVFAVLALFLACLVPTRADTQTWNISASCDAQNPFFPQLDCSMASNITAVFTTQAETGTFHEYEFNNDFVGTVNVVTGISGTFNGLPMALVVDPPGDWIGAPGFPELPENILFVAGGKEYDLFPDFGFAWLVPFGAPEEPLIWSAVDPAAVPEPSTLLLSLVGLCLITCSLARNRNRSAEGIGL